MHMLNSLHIIASRYSGGAERFYVWLISALMERGYPVSAINRPRSMVSRELEDAVPQTHVRMRNNYDILSKWQISGILKKLRPDIVMTYMSRATTLTRVSRGKRRFHVARLGGFYKIKYLRHVHAWVGITQGLCDYAIKEGLPSDKVFHIPNFVDTPMVYSDDFLSEVRTSLNIPEDALLVVSAGRFIKKKGFDILLSAFSRLPHTIGSRPVHMVLVGDGELKGELQRYSSELGIEDRVSWAGWQTDPDPYYDIADVVAFPSRFEPHGNIIKEAWSHRKALISTKTYGALELVTHGSTGLLVSNDAPGSLADAMLLALSDEVLRESLALKGNERLERDFSKEIIVDKYIELFERLLQKS
jgi:glycosyltransferase involved in cell wall biosynthesis